MSEERDETSWTRTLKATPAAEGPTPLAGPQTQFVQAIPPSREPTVPRALGRNALDLPPDPASDLDESTRPSLGPPVLPHTELTQPSPWQHEPTRTLGPAQAPDLEALQGDKTIPADHRPRSPASVDVTVKLPIAKLKRKRKRKSSTSWTAAKSGLAGLATALVISIVVMFFALASLL